MVGGEHGDDRLRVARSRPRGRGADSGGAIAPVRLEQDRRLGADLSQCSATRKRYSIFVMTTAGAKIAGSADQADDRLKGRALADQGNELLGQAFARFRPHAGAGPAAHDNRHDFDHAFSGLAGAFANSPAVLPLQ